MSLSNTAWFLKICTLFLSLWTHYILLSQCLFSFRLSETFYLRLGFLCQSLISFAMDAGIVSMLSLKLSNPLFIKREDQAPFLGYPSLWGCFPYHLKFSNNVPSISVVPNLNLTVRKPKDRCDAYTDVINRLVLC